MKQRTWAFADLSGHHTSTLAMSGSASIFSAKLPGTKQKDLAFE